MSVTATERFWSRVDTSAGYEECWPWAGPVDASGYGRLTFGGAGKRAHQVALALCGETVPAGHEIRHLCDNPRCCNPGHLVPGTRRENVRDRLTKGRGYKLNMELAEIIRRRVESGETQTAVAKSMGVSRPCVSNIMRGRTWS